MSSADASGGSPVRFGPIELRPWTQDELEEIEGDIERLESALGRLVIAFGNLEDDYRWLLGRLIGDHERGTAIAARLNFTNLVGLCKQLGDQAGFDSLGGAITAALGAQSLRNPMVHAAWWPSRDAFRPFATETRSRGTAERVRVRPKDGRAVHTIPDIEEVEKAARACEAARGQLRGVSEVFEEFGEDALV